MEQERRWAPDGVPYTKQEFLDFYGSEYEWDCATPYVTHSWGAASTKAQPVKAGLQPKQPGLQPAPAMVPPPGYGARVRAQLPKTLDSKDLAFNAVRCEAVMSEAMYKPVPYEEDDDGYEADIPSAAEMLKQMGMDSDELREHLSSALGCEISEKDMANMLNKMGSQQRLEDEAGEVVQDASAEGGPAGQEPAGALASAAAAEPEADDAQDPVRGDWCSDKGECSIFDDRITSRLAYEEKFPEGNRLHGWLVRQTDQNDKPMDPAIWTSKLWILEEDEAPWYGPSFGEEPEYVGDIQVSLLPEGRIQTRIKVVDEDDEWSEPIMWRRKAPPPVVAEGTFVFGQ